MSQDSDVSRSQQDGWVTRTSKDNLGWEKETHPAYGVIGISRVAGRASLFNSATVHQHYISLTIKEASRNIDGTREFVMGHKELINISMTEAQFAQMITQPNQGDGVSCTVRHVHGDQDYGNRWGRPEPPDPEPFLKKFKKEAGDRGEMISASLKSAKDLVEGLIDGSKNPTKANLAALKASLADARLQFDRNMPYVLEMMEETMEDRMATAVVEFESYVSQSLQAKGLEHMTTTAPQLAIGQPELKALESGK